MTEGRRRPPGQRLSPRKLLLTKWTAVVPRNKETHVMLIRVVLPEPPSVWIDLVELAAVHSKRSFPMQRRELTDRDQWQQGRV